VNLLIKEFIKKYWWRYLIGILFLITVDIIQLFIPRQIGSIVDILNTQSPNLNQVKTLVFGIIMLALGLGIGRVFWRISIIGAARLFEYKSWKKMFNHIIGLDQDFFDKWRTGDLMTRFTSDVLMLRRMMGMSVIMLVDTITMTTLTLFAMGTFVNWRLTFLSVLPLPLIAIISLFFGRFIHRRFRELQEKTSELSNITEENVSGVDVVKLYSNYDTMQEIFDNKSQEFYNSYIRLVKVWGLMFPLAMLVGQLATIFVFNFGGPMVINNQITLGDFIMTNQYIGMLIWPMMAVGNLINLIQRGRASLRRVNEVLEQKNSIKEPPRKDFEFQGHYQINHLTFKYPGSQRIVLKDVNMNINPGEMVAFVGRIGSGKSTLAKLLVKLYPVERGQIFLDGKDINDVNGEFIRDYVSYVPQDSFLFSMTIRENIAFSDEKMEDKVEEFAKLSHVHDDIMSFENKYDTIVGERGATLSGGQRQRVTIARALAKRSKMIILDDCLSAVDTETEEEIIKTLRQQAKGKTIVVISHRLKAVKNADQIYVFDDGQIVENGNHNQLISREGIYYSMYMKQLIEKNLEE
jgi:ATP-binding cassette subfamily B protein